MNLNKISATNQQLRCFKLHLQLLLQVCKTDEDQHLTALKKAYSQSLCFHFVLLYRAFLQEISADYLVKVPLEGSFSGLSAQLEQVGVVSSQCQMLADLEQDSNSWLSVVLSRYENYLSLSAERIVSSKTNDNSIGFKDLNVVSVEQEIESAGLLLNEVIEQYRDLMQEW